MTDLPRVRAKVARRGAQQVGQREAADGQRARGEDRAAGEVWRAHEHLHWVYSMKKSFDRVNRIYRMKRRTLFSILYILLILSKLFSYTIASLMSGASSTISFTGRFAGV